MSLILARASATDAARIAEIHMAAFGQNGMLLAQFPTPEVRKRLQKTIEAKALADIQDPKITVLVVRDVRDNKGTNPKRPAQESSDIIGFAKWTHPITANESWTESEWIWPEGTAWAVLEAWIAQVEIAERKVLGERPCYRLTFMATDPQHERRGAATMMVQWGIKHCKLEGIPAYLESTLEALPLYRKNSFQATVEIVLKIREKTSDDDSDIFYKEYACLFQPRLESSDK